MLKATLPQETLGMQTLPCWCAGSRFISSRSPSQSRLVSIFVSIASQNSCSPMPQHGSSNASHAAILGICIEAVPYSRSRHVLHVAINACRLGSQAWEKHRCIHPCSSVCWALLLSNMYMYAFVSFSKLLPVQCACSGFPLHFHWGQQGPGVPYMESKTVVFFGYLVWKACPGNLV